MRKKASFIFVLVPLWLLSLDAYAQVKEITVTHRYTLGDNDTRNDARDICFLQAKKMCLEKAGVFVEADFLSVEKESTSAGFSHLTQQQVRSYSGAFIQVEIVSESLQVEGDGMVMTMTVRANVDMADLKGQLSKIVSNEKAKEVVEKQQEQIDVLESKVTQLTEQLSSMNSTTGDTRQLRSERSKAITSLGSLEERKQQVLLRMKDREYHRQKVVSLIETGMTMQDVLDILGEPDSVRSHRERYRKNIQELSDYEGELTGAPFDPTSSWSRFLCSGTRVDLITSPSSKGTAKAKCMEELKTQLNRTVWDIAGDCWSYGTVYIVFDKYCVAWLVKSELWDGSDYGTDREGHRIPDVVRPDAFIKRR